MKSKVKEIREKKTVVKGSIMKQIMLFVAITLVGSAILVYLGISFYYTKHFFANTIINGIDCSNLTVEKAEELITYEVRNYVLTLEERGNNAEQIIGSDIELEALLDVDLEDVKKDQNAFLWLFNLTNEHSMNIDMMLIYDEELFEHYYEMLECLNEENVVKPTDAYISEYSENGYKIIEEEQGNLVKKKKLYDLVTKAIVQLKDTVSLEESDCYEKPQITSKEEGMAEAVTTMNQYVDTKITYQFGEDIEILDGEKIHEWIDVDENYQVSFDEQGIKDFVDYIGKTYNTFGKTRTLKTSFDGQVVEVSGGDYGWWLNRVAEVEELKTAIMNGEQKIKEPNYYQKAAHYGDDDIGNTYVEINLTAQHLFYYKDGKLIAESDFVSGNPNRGNETPTGTYSLTYKQLDATLTGENYATPVNYWMPFNKNVGMHDAKWRSTFGKDIYKSNGSHGCINLPFEVAEKIYENIEKGCPVYCYELPGTENYSEKKDKKVSE